jgi:hypothetical protein
MEGTLHNEAVYALVAAYAAILRAVGGSGCGLTQNNK